MAATKNVKMEGKMWDEEKEEDLRPTGTEYEPDVDLGPSRRRSLGSWGMEENGNLNYNQCSFPSIQHFPSSSFIEDPKKGSSDGIYPFMSVQDLRMRPRAVYSFGECEDRWRNCHLMFSDWLNNLQGLFGSQFSQG